MSRAEIAMIEDAGRASMTHEPDVYRGEADFGFTLKAVTPVLGILAIAAALLFVIV